MRVGIVGAGGMGTCHAANLARRADVTIAAVADPVEAAAARLAAAHDALVLTPELMAVDTGIDALVVASPDETHAAIVALAVDAGQAVLCEKPLAHTVAAAASLVSAEVATQRRLVRVGFMRTVDPRHLAVATRVGELGPVTRLRCVHRNVHHTPRPIGTVLIQSVIHDIHTVRWLTGAEFAAVTVHLAPRGDGFRSVLVVGELTDGAIATIEFDDHAPRYEVQVEAVCEGGIVTTDPGPAGDTDWFGWFADAYRAEVDEWVDAVTGGSFAGPSCWDGYAAQVVAEACAESLRSGGRVAVVTGERPDLYR